MPAYLSTGHAVHAVMLLLPSPLNTFAVAAKRPLEHSSHILGVVFTLQYEPTAHPTACEHDPGPGVGLGVGVAVGLGVGLGVGAGVGAGVGMKTHSVRPRCPSVQYPAAQS